MPALALLAPSLTFLLVFFLSPFCVSFWESVVPDGEGPTARLYYRALTDPYYLKVLWHTVVFSTGVTLLTLVLGYPVGLFLARRAGRARGVCLFLVVAPILTSVVIRSYGWMIILGQAGLVNSALMALGLVQTPVLLLYNWTGVVIGTTHVLLPFMILAVYSQVEGVDPDFERAARTMGASAVRAFRHVTLPLSLPGIVTGTLLVFVLAMGTFVTVLLLGGLETTVLPLLVYQQITVAFDTAFASTLGTVLLAASLAGVSLQLAFLRAWGGR